MTDEYINRSQPRVETPRLCQAHFGLFDTLCRKGCGQFCVAAEPEKVNARIEELERELAGYRKAERDRNEALNTGSGGYKP